MSTIAHCEPREFDEDAIEHRHQFCKFCDEWHPEDDFELVEMKAQGRIWDVEMCKAELSEYDPFYKEPREEM